MHNNTANKSTILSKKTVYASKLFKVDQVEIERKGKTFQKDIITRRPHVLILPLTSENEIYLIKEYRDVYQKELLEVVAGYIEENEDPLVGAKRELEEETGLTAQTWQHLSTIQTSANMHSTIHIFLAKDLTEGVSQQDEDEEITLSKMPLEEAVKKVLAGEIYVSAYIASILLLDKLIKEGKI
jgi:ADP-ribose pyrophosphatase